MRGGLTVKQIRGAKRTRSRSGEDAERMRRHRGHRGMDSPWRHCGISLLLLLLFLLQPCFLLLLLRPADRPADRGNDGTMKTEDGKQFQPADEWRSRTLLQTTRAAVPFPPLQVTSGGQPCLLFQARKVSLRYEKQKLLDLTERTFSPQKPVDTSQSVCGQERATLVMRFGDVEDLKGFSIRLQLSNTFYESSGQWWFSVDGVSLLYNASEEAAFNASEVYAPASSSYRCTHVSSLQRYSALLLPGGERARRWAVTFTDFQIQAFNVTSGRFAPASDCSTFLTPAILMGLVTSLILLLVLAYALHMVVHLKHIEREDERKAELYYPERLHRCSVESAAERDAM